MTYINILILTFAAILGWFVIDIAFIDGYEVKGGRRRNFLKFLKPQNIKWLVLYIITSCLAILIANFLFASNFSLIDILIFLTSLVLIHAALVDLICYQVVLNPLIVGIVILLGTNLLLMVINGLNYQVDGFMPVENLIAGAVGALLFFLIIKITKGKGMGEGDLFVFALMALALGIGKTVIAFYVMVFAGCIYGIVRGIYLGKIKGVRLPFVPFMVLGFIVALLYGQLIIDFYYTVFNLN